VAGALMATTTKLSLDTLVSAAEEIAARDGLDALSMRRLAEHCGVGAMTIYGYVRTKEELLGALADRFLAEIEMPDASAPWQDQVADVFRSVREVMLAHPALAPILGSQRVDVTSAYRGAEVVFRALRGAGVADEDIVTAFRALAAFTVGAVQREIGVRGSDAALPRLATLPAAEFPTVASVAATLAARDPAEDFERGLGLLIAGIAP
jgi:AcrR family transcriptional regulator